MTDASDRSLGEDASHVEDGAIRAQYEWPSTPPSTAVVETVAIASNREPMALEPLYESLDPDALNTIVRSNGSPSTVAFSFAGYRVTVRSIGEIVVRDETG